MQRGTWAPSSAQYTRAPVEAPSRASTPALVLIRQSTLRWAGYPSVTSNVFLLKLPGDEQSSHNDYTAESPIRPYKRQ